MGQGSEWSEAGETDHNLFYCLAINTNDSNNRNNNYH